MPSMGISNPMQTTKSQIIIVMKNRNVHMIAYEDKTLIKGKIKG